MQRAIESMYLDGKLHLWKAHTYNYIELEIRLKFNFVRPIFHNSRIRGNKWPQIIICA